MSLRAETAKQTKYSKKNLELIQKLLTNYAKIEILENNKVLYHGTVDGNLTKKGWSMKKDISLGEFKPGAGKNLIVKLSLSEEMCIRDRNSVATQSGMSDRNPWHIKLLTDCFLIGNHV